MIKGDVEDRPLRVLQQSNRTQHFGAIRSLQVSKGRVEERRVNEYNGVGRGTPRNAETRTQIKALTRVLEGETSGARVACRRSYFGLVARAAKALGLAKVDEGGGVGYEDRGGVDDGGGGIGCSGKGNGRRALGTGTVLR
jgi:hypothetical protein